MTGYRHLQVKYQAHRTLPDATVLLPVMLVAQTLLRQ